MSNGVLSTCGLQSQCLRDYWVLYSLNQCSLEPGLGTLSDGRDRLALDEPNISLPSPT